MKTKNIVAALFAALIAQAATGADPESCTPASGAERVEPAGASFLGLPVLSTDREEMRAAAQAAGLSAIYENGANNTDAYAAGASFEYGEKVHISYLNSGEIVRVETSLPANTEEVRILGLIRKLAECYGEPRNSRGESLEGPFVIRWLPHAMSGVELERGKAGGPVTFRITALANEALRDVELLLEAANRGLVSGQ